jgi:hypothetical protein
VQTEIIGEIPRIPLKIFREIFREISRGLIRDSIRDSIRDLGSLRVARNNFRIFSRVRTIDNIQLRLREEPLDNA